MADIASIPRKPFVNGTGREAPAEPEAEAISPSRFMINKQSAVPLHVQLKEQIRYAIMSGAYQPGSPLPSIRELTAQLGIHRNTVHRVYLELQASGLLVSKAGKGVFVSDTHSEAVSLKELDALEHLIGKYFEEANALGINPITLAKMVDQRAPAWDVRHPTVAFVECTAHQSMECAKELAEVFGLNVQNFLLEDIRRDGKCPPAPIQHLVTSIFHYDEVKEMARQCGKRVHAVTYDLHPATRALLREVGPSTRLGFICHDANTEEVIGAQIEERVPSGVLVGCGNIEHPKQALELLNNVDTVLLSEPASTFVVENATPDHELLELHYALNPASVDKVTRLILYQP